jgi:hypothetical protein
MSAIDDQDTIGNVTRNAQIIIGALIAGVLTFVAISCFVDLRPDPQAGAPPVAGANGNVPAVGRVAPTDPFITYAAVLVAAISLPMSLVLPNLIAARSLREIAQAPSPSPSPGDRAMRATPRGMAQTETGKLASLYLSNLIVGAATNEGAAFFAAVAYLIEKNPIALGTALVLVAVLIARFPTADRVNRWIELHREKLRDAGYSA